MPKKIGNDDGEFPGYQVAINPVFAFYTIALR